MDPGPLLLARAPATVLCGGDGVAGPPLPRACGLGSWHRGAEDVHWVQVESVSGRGSLQSWREMPGEADRLSLDAGFATQYAVTLEQ